MHEVAAIILAAGRSRRMGKFKPLLSFGDTTVIESCLGNFRAAGVGEIVVVVGHRAEEVRERLNLASVTFVTNPNPDAPMATSIALGVNALPDTAKAVLITPADHPAVGHEIIRLLIEKWHAGVKFIQPEYNSKGGHPVLMDLSYRDELIDLDREFGLRGFFAKHRAEVLRLAVDSPFVARDMDTWEDYVGLHQDVFDRKPEQTATPDQPNG